ncbi:MAG: ATP-grasp fold amidoligase family protein [Trueperaceae bacterium]
MNPYLKARVAAQRLKKALRKASRGRTKAARRETLGELVFGDFLDRRHEWLFANLPRESAEYLHGMHGKDEQKELARRLGLSVAEEYVSQVPLKEALKHIEVTRLERFVLKPLSAKSGAGVVCAVKQDDGYLDLKRGTRTTLQGIGNEAYLGYAKLGRADRWLVEELLLPSDGTLRMIEDYKFHCFAGRVEFILQKGDVEEDGQVKHAIRFYDRDWRPVDTGMRPDLQSDALTPPPTGNRMVEVAEHAASQIPMPFLRVDLYDSHRGIVLGEFTPGPGGRRLFNQEWTERLTRRWHEAAAELEARLASGELKPLFPERSGTRT